MRRWLRSVSFLAVLVGVAALASCGGGGGGSKEFDFTGTWLFHETVAVNNGMPDFSPAGGRGEEFVELLQNGTTIVLTPAGARNGLVGTCDPDAGTFAIDYAAGGSRLVVNGARTGDDTMSGEIALTDGRGFVRFVYTADRL